MRKFIVTGHGRKVGAIGIFYPFRATVESTSADQAAIDVYSQYEHITGMRVEDAPAPCFHTRDMDGTCHLCGAVVESCSHE